MPDKHAILLLNLGSPEKPETAEVREYLREFLTDPRVIDVPYVRKFVVPQIILRTRPAKSAEAYREVWTEEGSPLIVTSQNQQRLLREATGLPVYLAMRYGNPSTPDVVRKIIEDGVRELFIVPLYPHYAMSSYESAHVAVTDELQKYPAGQRPHWTLQQPFYNDPAYIDALVEKAKPSLAGDYDALLFSYHGIPERHLKLSDPSHAHCMCVEDCCNTPHPAHATCYRHQCVATTEAFVRKAGIPREKVHLSFQSRLGRDPWLQPYTDKTIERLATEGIKRLRVICPAFITDCLETLEEIAGEGAGIFKEHGGEEFGQIPCLNDSPEFIRWLADKAADWQLSLGGEKDLTRVDNPA